MLMTRSEKWKQVNIDKCHSLSKKLKDHMNSITQLMFRTSQLMYGSSLMND